MIRKFLMGLLILGLVTGCSAKQSVDSSTETAVGYAPDPIALAHVYTWEDINRNGVPDAGEPPIPFLTTRLAFPDVLTASDGWAIATSPAADCKPNCWDGETVSVKVPPGYIPTTPTSYSYEGVDVTYNFGFHSDGLNNSPSFPKEPSWQKAFINRGMMVLAFDYETNGELAITVDRNGTIVDDYYPEEFYTNKYYYDIFIFNIILELADAHDVFISEVKITLVPSGAEYVCAKSDLDEWQGGISGDNLLAQHCEMSQ